jgi:hypothetical protein
MTNHEDNQRRRELVDIAQQMPFEEAKALLTLACDSQTDMGASGFILNEYWTFLIGAYRIALTKDTHGRKAVW